MAEFYIIIARKIFFPNLGAAEKSQKCAETEERRPALDRKATFWREIHLKRKISPLPLSVSFVRPKRTHRKSSTDI